MNAKTAEDIASLGEIIPLPRNFTGMTIFQGSILICRGVPPWAPHSCRSDTQGGAPTEGRPYKLGHRYLPRYATRKLGKNSNRNRSGVPKGGWEIPRAAIEGARTCVKEARPLAFEVKLTTTSMPARIARKI